MSVRISKLVLTTTVAYFAMACLVRADVILSYHLSSYTGTPGNPNAPIPNNLPAGPQIDSSTGLVLSLGQTVYLQVAITANLTPPRLSASTINFVGTRIFMALAFPMI